MSQTRERYFEITLLGLILIIGAILFYQATPFINGILGAITLYILLRRVNIYCFKHLSPKVAPWVIVFAVTIFLIVPFSCVAWYIIDLFQTFNFDVQPLIDRAQRTLSIIEEKVGFDLISEDSIKFMTAKATGIAQMLMSGINNFAITLFTSLLLLFFLLSGSIKMERYIARLLPFNESNKHTIIKNITKIVRSNAIGIPLLAIIQGVIASICYSFVGVQNSVEFGILTGFASLIPIVGTMLVWIPLAASQYFEVGLASCIYVLASGFLVISQCDNVLRMFMQKRMANTHPLITISGVIVGLPLFGFMGLIFGPLLIAMFLLFLNMFTHQYILGEAYQEEEGEQDENGQASTQPNGGNTQGGSSDKVKSNLVQHQGKLGSKQQQRTNANATPNKAKGRNNAPAMAKTQVSQIQAQPQVSKTQAQATNQTAQSQGQDESALQDTNTARPAPTPAKARPNLVLTDNQKSSKSKKDFKSAKAEHKHQKREAAKLLAEQERNLQAQNAEAQIEQAQVSPSTAAVESVVESKAHDSTTSSGVESSSESRTQALAEQVLAQGTEIPSLASAQALTLKEHVANEQLYNQDFSPSYDNLGPVSTDQSQLKGRSLVSRAVAVALQPFAEEQLNVTLGHSEHDVNLNADMINSESMQTTNKQTSNTPERAKTERRRNAHNRPRRAQSGASQAPRGRKDSTQDSTLPRQERPSQERAHGQQAATSSTNERSATHNAGRSQRGGKSATKQASGTKSSTRSNSRNASRGNAHGATQGNRSSHGTAKSNARTDKPQRKSESTASRNSTSRRSKARRHTTASGYEILRPERKRDDNFPMLQTVVSHQYGSFDSKPRSTLRTQLVSVHTAKGTMMASNTRRRSGKRRSAH